MCDYEVIVYLKLVFRRLKSKVQEHLHCKLNLNILYNAKYEKLSSPQK